MLSCKIVFNWCLEGVSPCFMKFKYLKRGYVDKGSYECCGRLLG